MSVVPSFHTCTPSRPEPILSLSPSFPSQVTQYNSANNELNYALLISNISAKVDPTFTPKFVIDTGRNGTSLPPSSSIGALVPPSLLPPPPPP